MIEESWEILERDMQTHAAHEEEDVDTVWNRWTPALALITKTKDSYQTYKITFKDN